MLLIEGTADRLGDTVAGEGLLNEVDPIFEHGVVGDDVGGIARHEEDLEARAQRVKRAAEVSAVHVRHDDVRDEKVDLLGVSLRDTQRLTRALGGEHAVAELRKQALTDVEEQRLVLDEEDRLITRGGEGFVARRRCRRGRDQAGGFVVGSNSARLSPGSLLSGARYS